MSTMYKLGNDGAIRPILDRLASFAGRPDIMQAISSSSSAPEGWVSISTASDGSVSLVAARMDLIARVPLDGVIVEGDAPPPEVLIPLEWMARLAKLAGSLSMPIEIEVDLNTNTATMSGLGSTQVITDRPGPPLRIGQPAASTVMDTEKLRLALRRASAISRQHGTGNSDAIPPQIIMGFGATDVTVVAMPLPSSHMLYAERLPLSTNDLDGVAIRMPGPLTSSLMNNLHQFLGHEITVGVDSTTKPTRLIVTPKDAPASGVYLVIGLISGNSISPQTFDFADYTLTPPLQEAAQIYVDQSKLTVWLRALAKARTDVRIAVTNRGGSFVAEGDTPKGQATLETLVIPPSSTSTSGIGETVAITEYLLTSVAAMAGTDEDESVDKDSKGIITLALVPMPRDPKILTINVRLAGVGGAICLAPIVRTSKAATAKAA